MENEKIVRIDTLIINRRREKNCKCLYPSYEVDTTNRLVYCKKCMAVVEPFVALERIAIHSEILNAEIENAIEYRNELMNYKPFLREAKRYEKMMREKNMLPVCPKCGEPFEWQEVTRMINRKFAEKLKKESDIQ